MFAATTNFSKKSDRPIVWEKPLETIPLGEKLYYDVNWLGVHIGYGQLEVKEMTEIEGRKAFHVIATAKTNEVLSMLYPVRDELHSFIDAETLYPLEFRKKLSEGRYRADERTVFDASRKKGHYESYLNKSKKEFKIGGQVHDLISAFYWFRRQEARPGQSLKTVVSSEEKDWDFEVQVIRGERKEFRGGVVMDTMLTEPKTRLKGVLYARGRAWVHFTTDSRRLPVLIRLSTPFGPVTGALRTPVR